MSIAEEWAANNGINTFSVNERDGYILDNKMHRTMTYHKPMPDYIKIVK
jgi:hypothetical protein